MSSPLAPSRLGAYAACFFLLLLAATLRGDPATSHAISIRDGFDPASLTIHAGDTVVWTNNDDRDHDVTAVDKSFQSGNLKAGQSFSHPFPTPGQYPYACSLHPRERGLIIVEK